MLNSSAKDGQQDCQKYSVLCQLELLLNQDLGLCLRGRGCQRVEGDIWRLASEDTVLVDVSDRVGRKVVVVGSSRVLGEEVIE